MLGQKAQKSLSRNSTYSRKKYIKNAGERNHRIRRSWFRMKICQR